MTEHRTGPAAPVRVLIADDHVPTRHVVRTALEEDGLEVVAECATAPHAVELAQDHRPDVCLLDIHMPGDGVMAAVAMARKLPDSTVVMLSSSRDSADVAAAIRAGAKGYLLKDSDQDLGPALRRILDGQTVFPRTTAGQQIDLTDPVEEPAQVSHRHSGLRAVLHLAGIRVLRRRPPGAPG